MREFEDDEGMAPNCSRLALPADSHLPLSADLMVGYEALCLLCTKKTAFRCLLLLLPLRNPARASVTLRAYS